MTVFVGRIPARRSGFTVLELVVGMGIIGFLLALLIPAVQSARESARRLDCTNRLHQLGIATASYEQRWGMFAGLHTYRALRADLGLTVLEGTFNRRSPPVYRCPSDPAVSGENGQVSYLFSQGCRRQEVRHLNGVIGRSTYLIKNPGHVDIVDGASQTACMSEHLVQWPYGEPLRLPTDEDPRRYMGYIPAVLVKQGEFDAFIESCLTERIVDSPLRPAGTNIFLQMARGYDHNLPPNSLGCHNSEVPLFYEEPSSALMAFPASSFHQGGVNVLFCDGSVHNISDGIDSLVWQALGSIDGHEVNASAY